MSITFPTDFDGNTYYAFAELAYECADKWTSPPRTFYSSEARDAEVAARAAAIRDAVDPEDHDTLDSLVDAMMAVAP